jgi:enterochelin esterase family protein
MAGLSMGGGQTLQITLNHLDRFAWIGAFSAGLRLGDDLKAAYGGAFADAAAFNKQVRLLWLGAGTAEERAHKALLTVHDTLDKAGIRHSTYVSQGTSHEWQTWRRHLNEFAPLLFK